MGNIILDDQTTIPEELYKIMRQPEKFKGTVEQLITLISQSVFKERQGKYKAFCLAADLMGIIRDDDQLIRLFDGIIKSGGNICAAGDPEELLSLTIRRNRKAIFDYLLAKNANTYALGYPDQTPLYIAVLTAQPYYVQQLLAKRRTLRLVPYIPNDADVEANTLYLYKDDAGSLKYKAKRWGGNAAYMDEIKTDELSEQYFRILQDALSKQAATSKASDALSGPTSLAALLTEQEQDAAFISDTITTAIFNITAKRRHTHADLVLKTDNGKGKSISDLLDEPIEERGFCLLPYVPQDKAIVQTNTLYLYQNNGMLHYKVKREGKIISDAIASDQLPAPHYKEFIEALQSIKQRQSYTHDISKKATDALFDLAYKRWHVPMDSQEKYAKMEEIRNLLNPYLAVMRIKEQEYNRQAVEAAEKHSLWQRLPLMSSASKATGMRHRNLNTAYDKLPTDDSSEQEALQANIENSQSVGNLSDVIGYVKNWIRNFSSK